MSGVNLNFWIYAAGALVLGLCCLPFLRRDFDRLCDRPLEVLLQLLIGCGLLLLGNILVAAADLLSPGCRRKPQQRGRHGPGQPDGENEAMAVFLAPLVEELMFRGGIFGLLRRRSRALAYAGCILLFSVYHVWQYALSEPGNWLFLLQYLPSSFLLCRCYEKTETIWAPLLFHMLNNAVSRWP